MPEIEGSNRGILLPNLVMEIGVSVNEDNPKFCRLQRVPMTFLSPGPAAKWIKDNKV